MDYHKTDMQIDIAKALLRAELINTDIYEKCSKPHITELPHDLRTNDKEKLQERETEINNRISENIGRIDDFYEVLFEVEDDIEFFENREQELKKNPDENKKELESNRKLLNEAYRDRDYFKNEIQRLDDEIGDYKNELSKINEKVS